MLSGYFATHKSARVGGDPLPDPAAEGSAPPLEDAMPIKDRILMKDEAPIKEEIPIKDQIPIKDEGGRAVLAR